MIDVDDEVLEDEDDLFDSEDLLAAKAVRNCIIAPEGFLIVGADMDQVEMRIIGALAGEQSMIEAAHNDESQHEVTCRLMHGEPPLGFESWKSADPEIYKLGKVAGFCAVYGGGGKAISEQAHVSLEVGNATARLYRESLPALAEYKNIITESVLDEAFNSRQKYVYKQLRKELWSCETETERKAVENQIKRLCYGKVGSVTTPFGRRLYVDADRAYSGVNYIVQSTARDVLAMGLLRLARSSFSRTVLMAVHDEVIGEAREEDAEVTAFAYGRLMTTRFMGVPLTSTGEVYGKRWGDNY